MLDSFLWGLVATSSLVIGGLLGSWLKIRNRTLGVIMAFGAGVLISAVAYELPNEAFRLATTIGFPAVGFFIGALTFFFSDILIEKAGAKNRKSIKAEHSSDLVIPLVLATILDGIPESIVIGLSLLEGGVVSMSMMVAVFISNLPEAIAGTAGMKAGKWRVGKILLVWLFIAIICAVSSFAGYSLLAGVSDNWLAFIQAFAGGAIMVMLANTMIPEAYEHGGKLAGIFTILGFAVSMLVVMLEHTGGH